MLNNVLFLPKTGAWREPVYTLPKQYVFFDNLDLIEIAAEDDDLWETGISRIDECGKECFTAGSNKHTSDIMQDMWPRMANDWINQIRSDTNIGNIRRVLRHAESYGFDVSVIAEVAKARISQLAQREAHNHTKRGVKSNAQAKQALLDMVNGRVPVVVDSWGLTVLDKVKGGES